MTLKTDPGKYQEVHMAGFRPIRVGGGGGEGVQNMSA